MLQSYISEPQTSYDDQESGLDLLRYYGVLKKRIFYLIIPFVLVLVAGAVVTAIQRPIFVSEGKILIESQEIPVDLVRPTVTSAASERIQVIEQRIMTRDNLLAIVNKYGLFPSQRKWMSGTQLLDLMRERQQIKLIEATASARRDVTIAFTVSFEYEVPELAMKVANEFVTLILNEDARTRTNRAMETTKFLSREVARLEAELGASEGQISELKRKKIESDRKQLQSGIVGNTGPDPLVVQLTSLKADLLQKTAVYSNEHPAVKVLKQRIAALEKTVAEAPPVAARTDASGSDENDKFGIDALEKQRSTIERGLEDATRKLTAARLGESLERDQQSERLEVIEQPTMPQKPIKPNRMKLLAMTFIAAVMAGVGAMFAIELFDRTIRGSQELFGVVDGHLLVSIPYISTRGEALRRKRRRFLMMGSLAVVLLSGLSTALYLGLLPTDLSFVDTSWIDSFRSLTK